MKIYVVRTYDDRLKVFKSKEKALTYRDALVQIQVVATVFETNLIE